MAVTRRSVTGLTARQVFDVLRDGRSYGDWVVGTRTIRDVDAGWPAEGRATGAAAQQPWAVSGPARSSARRE